ncbi:factor-independent urate hydroxylase [Streptomyces sp. SID3343]|uniref:factor-independent urate hydroxylase n=1 Tax=Streptomyces sp. SID3343 TaxID=2690260 RepID=UPI00136C2337|nr:urate oxidase [Streptomyces sp. SID3343]MYW01639.1 urate oxidase [Streptomyces sp. SID3343]
MAIVLGPNRYGKAEVRLVRVTRHTPTEHELCDLNVSVSLSGDLDRTHLAGDNAAVIPTDTMRAVVYAFAQDRPLPAVEEFGLRLARHFVDAYPSIDTARVRLLEYPWVRIPAANGPHPHAWTRASGARYAGVVHGAAGTEVCSGLEDVTVLKSTGSEFHGFMTDRYTTLRPTEDRVLATSVQARWRHVGVAADWDASFLAARDVMLRTFAETHSLALQQTLYAMGEAVLADRAELAEVRLVLPNRHHVLVDLSPFGQDNAGEVYHAADRPYGLIEGAVLRDDIGPALAELPW